MSLNPFEIRAGLKHAERQVSEGNVLIPLKSGLA